MDYIKREEVLQLATLWQEAHDLVFKRRKTAAQIDGETFTNMRRIVMDRGPKIYTFKRWERGKVSLNSLSNFMNSLSSRIRLKDRELLTMFERSVSKKASEPLDELQVALLQMEMAASQMTTVAASGAVVHSDINNVQHFLDTGERNE